MALSNRSVVLSLSGAIAVGILSCVAVWRWDWILEWRHRSIGKVVAQGLFLFAVLVFLVDTLREMVPSWRYHGGRTLVEDSDFEDEIGERPRREVAQDDVAYTDADVAKADAEVANADVAEEVVDQGAGLVATRLSSRGTERNNDTREQGNLEVARKKQQMRLEEDARRKEKEAAEKTRKVARTGGGEGRSAEQRRAERAPLVFPGEELRGWVAPQVREGQRIRAQQDEELAESERLDRERVSATQRAAEVAERQLAEEKERERDRAERVEKYKVQLREALPEEPLSEVEGRIVVVLNLGNRKRPKRAWRKTDHIRDLYNWFHSIDDINTTEESYTLATTYPRELMRLAEWGEKTLEEAGFEAQTLLVTEIVN